jgi:hypothetical protein
MRGGTTKMTRKQNAPKKYPGPKGTKNPRRLCPECEKLGKLHYLKKTKCLYNVDKKQHTVTPLSFCLECSYVERYEDVIKSIPD